MFFCAETSGRGRTPKEAYFAFKKEKEEEREIVYSSSFTGEATKKGTWSFDATRTGSQEEHRHLKTMKKGAKRRRKGCFLVVVIAFRIPLMFTSRSCNVKCRHSLAFSSSV
jgi:hypothetical protein